MGFGTIVHDVEATLRSLVLVSRELDILTSDNCSRMMVYAVDCERGGSAARP
jgi:hypothetical protein